MDYIYDIVLNFQKDYYDFYEWQPDDKILHIKRIPIYKIASKDYLNIKNHIVTIRKNSLSKQNKMFLLTNGVEVIGVLIDNKGKVVKKSSLIFEESDDILKDKNYIKSINIKYNIDKKNQVEYISRIKKEKYKYLNNYFNKINKTKDEYFLKYLYYEIFNIDERDINKVYDGLLKYSKEKPSEMIESIKRVTDELKKSFP